MKIQKNECLHILRQSINKSHIFLYTIFLALPLLLCGCADQNTLESASLKSMNTYQKLPAPDSHIHSSADNPEQNTDWQNADDSYADRQDADDSYADRQDADDSYADRQDAGDPYTEEHNANLRTTDSRSVSAINSRQSEKAPKTTEEMYRAILSIGTKSFFGSHPVNESFFKWLAKKYGDRPIRKLFHAVSAGNQNPKLWYQSTDNTIHVLWLLYCKESGLHPKQLKNVTWKNCASSKKITLAFTGDLNFSEGYSTTSHLDSCAGGIYDCFSADLLSLMNSFDIMLLNNEFTYSTRGTPLSGKAFTFRANPSRVGLLKVFGTDIVTLANNHVYDYGPDALLDTIATLDQAGIPHIGAGADLKKASEPYYFICNGRKIALVAATQIERSTNYTKEATKDSPGVLKTLNPDKFTKVIRNAKKNSDHVIAVVHWGTEGSSDYGQDQRDLAKAFVDAGADAIIGGHTHCLQGFEIMNGVPILYSTGNFWFSRRTQDTGLAKITINRHGKLAMSFIPCIQQNLRTYLVTEEAQKQRIFTFLQQHSAPGVKLNKNGKVT